MAILNKNYLLFDDEEIRSEFLRVGYISYPIGVKRGHSYLIFDDDEIRIEVCGIAALHVSYRRGRPYIFFDDESARFEFYGLPTPIVSVVSFVKWLVGIPI